MRGFEAGGEEVMGPMSTFSKFRVPQLMLAVALALGAPLSGCAVLNPSLPSEAAPMKTANPADGYVLEPGNRVRVIVFNEQTLSGDFTLDPNGNVSLPVVGNIPASGLTAKGLEARIENTLKGKGYLQNPQAAVEVETFRPFYVLGEVRQAGEFPYQTGMTILSAIAKAGGYDYRAWEGEVLLVRTVNGEQKEYRAVENTPILPGDIVKVLQRRI